MVMILNNPVWDRIGTLSASRINSYIRCGVKFYLEYVMRLRAPGNLNMHRGSGLHKAIEMDNKNFMVNEKRLSLVELLEYAHEEFDKKLSEGVFIPNRDIDKKDKLVDKAINEMEQSVKLYYEMEKPWIPASIEEHVQLYIDYPLPVVIRMDLVDRDDIIYDWKTMDKNTHYRVGIQDLLYSKAYLQEYGVKPKFRYVKFILTKKTPPRVEIQEIETPDTYEMLDRYINKYFHAIENNVFLPTTKQNYMCSEGGCPFFLNCEYQNN